MKTSKTSEELSRVVETPSENVQIEAVKENQYSIQYILNPSEEVQLEAVKQNGCSIQFIKNKSDKLFDIYL